MVDLDLEQIIQSTLLQKWINPIWLDKAALEQLHQEFADAKPFKHAYMDQLIVEDQLERVIEVLTEQEFEIKDSDLFQLAQTADFDDLDQPILRSFKKMFQSDQFVALMEYITNVDLSNAVDMLGNIYSDTDYLLCHDDKLIKRKVAYILYLTDLEEEDGGALHLFDTKDEQPNKIVKRIFPRYNRLTFFEVTRQSFHEVGEVLQPDIYRVSISGWFNNTQEVEA